MHTLPENMHVKTYMQNFLDPRKESACLGLVRLLRWSNLLKTTEQADGVGAQA